MIMAATFELGRVGADKSSFTEVAEEFDCAR
jgi:hypothetical protein